MTDIFDNPASSVPSHDIPFMESSPPPDVEALREMRNFAIGRIAVNSVTMAVDMVPSVLDPSTLMDAINFAQHMAGRAPEWVRNIPVVGKVVDFMERYDPTPDVSPVTVLGATAIEVGTVVIPSSVITRGWQIVRDAKRVRDANRALAFHRGMQAAGLSNNEPT